MIITRCGNGEVLKAGRDIQRASGRRGDAIPKRKRRSKKMLKKRVTGEVLPGRGLARDAIRPFGGGGF